MNEIVPYQHSLDKDQNNSQDQELSTITNKYLNSKDVPRKNSIDRNHKKILDNKGRKVYKKKKNMRELLDVMTNDSFKSFFDDNFQSWDDIRTVVILMSTLRYIDKCTKDKNLNKYQQLALLETILSNSENRSLIFKYFTNNNKLITPSVKSSDDYNTITPSDTGKYIKHIIE